MEAIIALPNDIFYNTGIATYIWVLSNKKAGTRREGKVQLINANALYEKRRKALGEEYVLPLLREAKSLGLGKEELLAMVKEAIEHEGGEKA